MSNNIHDYYYNIVAKQQTAELYARAEEARLIKTAKELAREQRRAARADRRAAIQDHTGTGREAGLGRRSRTGLRSWFGRGHAARPEPQPKAPEPSKEHVHS